MRRSWITSANLQAVELRHSSRNGSTHSTTGYTIFDRTQVCCSVGPLFVAGRHRPPCGGDAVQRFWVGLVPSPCSLTSGVLQPVRRARLLPRRVWFCAVVLVGLTTAVWLWSHRPRRMVVLGPCLLSCARGAVARVGPRARCGSYLQLDVRPRRPTRLGHRRGLRSCHARRRPGALTSSTSARTGIRTLEYYADRPWPDAPDQSSSPYPRCLNGCRTRTTATCSRSCP